MSDWRVSYLRLLEYHPHSIALGGVLGFSALAMAALTLERTDICVTKIRPWLIGAFARHWFRLICSVLSSMVCLSGASKTLQSTIEILDVMGVVWFALLLIAVIPQIDCLKTSPLMYISCLVYVGSMFSYVFCYCVVVTTLQYYPPASAADREYLMERRARYSRDSENASSPLMASDERAFWKSWLEKYGSFEFVYDGTNAHKENKHQNTSVKGRKLYGSKSSSESRTVETMSQSADGTDIGDMGSGCDIEMGRSQYSKVSMNAANNTNAASEAAADAEDQDAAEMEHADCNDSCAICLLPFEVRAVTNPLNSKFHNLYPTPMHNHNNYNHNHNHIMPTLLEEHDRDVGNVGAECGIDHEESKIEEGHGASEQQQEAAESICAAAAGSAVTVECEIVSNDGEDNSIIVRYPCPGSHYFHAHCLHEWLRVNAAGLHSRQGRLAGLVGDYRDNVTCPVCREKPSVNINAFKRTHFV